MSETITELTQDEQTLALLQQLMGTIDPKDFMKQGQREIVELTLDELTVEYNLIQIKLNSRSRKQRDFIVARWEYEQTKSALAPPEVTKKKSSKKPQTIEAKKIKKIDNEQK